MRKIMKKNIYSFVEKDLRKDLDKDSGFLMLRVSKLWEEAHEKALKRHYDISYMQYAVLASIHWLALHEQKSVTQIKLSKHTKISPMTISQTLKTLEAKGYVCRRVYTGDVRAKCAFLTPKGEELLHKAFRVIYATDEKFFYSLGRNRQEFDFCMVKLLGENE